MSALEQTSDSDTEIVYLSELRYVDKVQNEKLSSSWLQNINGNNVLFKLDTGAQVNIIPKSEILKWNKKPMVWGRANNLYLIIVIMLFQFLVNVCVHVKL